MSEMKCSLQLLDLYFSKYNFTLDRNSENFEYNTSFKIEYAINNDDASKVRITIDTTVSNADKTIGLDLQTVGVFKVDKNDVDEATYDALVKANTVAIIFPFIRSQISLLTTQPGMKPIIMPPININSIIQSKTNDTNE